MIKVKFDVSSDKKIISLSLKGHAGQNSIGKDIICASASMLAFTVAQAIKDMHAGGQLAKKPKISLKKGNIEITCKPKAESYAEALHTFFVAEIGYNLLQHNYPQYVNLEMFSRGLAPEE